MSKYQTSLNCYRVGKMAFFENVLLLVVVLSLGRSSVSQDDDCFYNSYSTNNLVILPQTFHKKFTLPKNLDVGNYIWSYTITLEDSDSPMNIKPFLKKFDGVDGLSIPPSKLKEDDIELEISGRKRDRSRPGPQTFEMTCEISTVYLDAFVSIAGGNERVVPENREIVVNGEETYDPNEKKKTNKNLVFFWTCKQKLKPFSFCPQNAAKTITSQQQFKIPANRVKAKDEFNIKLKASNEFTSNNYSQKITVIPDAADLEIHCTKNCRQGLKASYTAETEFEVKCLFNCGGITEEDYLWTVDYDHPDDTLKFDYNKSSRFGRTGTKFIIKKNVLEAAIDYRMTVKLKPEKKIPGKASMMFYFYEDPAITDCRLKPSSKDKNKFIVECKDKDSEENDSETHYEIFARDPDNSESVETITKGQFNFIWNNPFELPSEADYKDIFIKISRQARTVVDMLVRKHKLQRTTTTTTTKLTTTTKPTTTTKQTTTTKSTTTKPTTTTTKQTTTTKSTTTKPTTSTKATTPTKSTTTTKPTTTAVVTTTQQKKNSTKKHSSQELHNISIHNFIKRVPGCPENDMTKDLLKAPAESVAEAMETILSLKKMAHKSTGTHCGMTLFKDIITACKKIAEVSLNMAKNAKSTFIADNRKEISSTMTSCLSIEPNKNFKPFGTIKLNVTTLKPNVDYPLLTEQYPNYVDPNENYYQNIDIMQHVTFDIINGSSVTAKLMALSANVNEGFIKSIGEAATIGAIKDTGDNLRKTSIRSDNVTVVPSEDFINDNHRYDILVTTWHNDIFWWNPREVQVVTNIISCEVWHTSCKKRVENFTKPFHIYFDTKSDILKSREIIEDFLKIPKNYFSLSNDEMNYRIRVHFMYLSKGIEVFIHFHNLSDSFEVVLTRNKFPTMEDFTTSVNISRGHETLTVTNDHDQDIFLYVGIIPNRKIVKEQFVKYTVSFSVRTCVRWMIIKNQWIPSCQLGSGSNDTVIHCECTHLSVIAGYEQTIPSTLKDVIKPDIELELRKCLIIFVTVVVSFGVFFIIFLCVSFEKKVEVYYLCDNNSKDRYAYLLIVNTGNGFKSGTTSNIVVTLIGSKESSEPHVLNYPDPRLKLLQQCGNDMFLMTTENHLGDLERIEIWFDSIGMNPYWHCRKIIVYDLQKRQKWEFLIENRLSVVKRVVFIVAEPVEGELDDNAHKLNKLGFILQKLPFKYHTWLLCQYESHYSHLKKITVVLSTILSVYALVLVFYCRPTFQLLDGFDDQYYHFDPNSVLVAFGASLLAFLVHVFIVWYFRSSNIQFSRYDDVVQLSFVFTKLCWIFLMILIVLTTSFLISAGFWVPPNRSWIWLSTCAVGLAFIVVVYENIFLLFQSFYSKLTRFDVWVHFTIIVEVIMKQRIYLSEIFGEVILRPYLEHLYRPLSRREIRGKLRRLAKRKNVLSEFQDLIMFFVYIIILYIVVLANKDSLVVQANITMEEIVEGVYTRTMSFTTMETILDIYKYFNETFIPVLHPLRWYGNYVISDPALMVDMTNKFIGIARIRQHRLKPNICEVAEQMRFLNTTCSPEFKHEYSETRTLGYKWANISRFWYYDRMRGMWAYSKQKKTETLFTWGEFSLYSGGGYIALLGRTVYNSYANFRKIFNNLWIDDETRVVFIEFLTYSADYNIFNSIRLTFEQSAVGYLYKDVDVYTVRMLFVENEVEVFTSTFFILFMLWVGMLLIRLSIGTIKNFRNLYKDPWTIIDSVIILSSILCIVLFLIRTTLIGNYLKSMEHAKHNQFLNYFYMFYIENFLTFAAAFLVAIATIRLWIFFRFALIFRIMEKTLAFGAAPLLSFAIVFGILVSAFAMCIVLLMGNESKRIHSVSKTIRLLMTAALKPSELASQEFINHPLVLFYMSVYGILLLLSVFVIITIILVAYAEAQLEFSSETDSYTIRHYVQERFSYFPKFLKYKYKRFRAGQTNFYKVEPKPDKFIYSHSLSVPTSRMTFMKYLTQSVLRNKKQFRKTGTLSEDDCQLMLNVFRMFICEKEEDNSREVFYKGRVRNRRIRFVYEKQIEKIANVVNFLLQEDLSFVDFYERRDAGLDECLRKIKENQKTIKLCCNKLKLVQYQMISIERDFKKLV